MSFYAKLLYISVTFYAAEYDKGYSTKKIARTLKRQCENGRDAPHAVNGTARHSRYCRPGTLCNSDRISEARPIAQEQRSWKVEGSSQVGCVYLLCAFCSLPQVFFLTISGFSQHI